mmetsp:Transcript_21843/g.30603  ORF Transcript_21843/g.30603 Transcript_21843/m.30603 type:complete len:242 (-) Transcript_21843:285-1010(-)
MLCNSFPPPNPSHSVPTTTAAAATRFKACSRRNDSATASILESMSPSTLPPAEKSQDEVASAAGGGGFAEGDMVEWRYGSAWVRVQIESKAQVRQTNRKGTNRSVRRRAEGRSVDNLTYTIRVLDDAAISSLVTATKVANNEKVVLTGVAPRFLRRKREEREMKPSSGNGEEKAQIPFSSPPPPSPSEFKRRAVATEDQLELVIHLPKRQRQKPSAPLQQLRDRKGISDGGDGGGNLRKRT